MCAVMSLGVSVFAGEPETRSAEDSYFPTAFIGYALSSGVNTPSRVKENGTWHYVMNNSGFDLWVISKTSDGANHTKGNHAIVPGGEWFVTNYVYENRGRTRCYLNLTSAKAGVSGYLSGKWSPDSVGSYPVAN